MEWTRQQGRYVAIAAFVAVAAVTLARLAAYGIWDPWELSAADLARQLATGEAGALDQPALTPWLVAQGFTLFGIHEWAGRLPMALSGLVAVALAYVVAARFAGRRAGAWAALIAGTSPLFLLNARAMLGAAPGFAASGAVFVCAMAAVFAPARLDAPEALRTRALAGWLLGLVVASALAVLASGVLLGVAPPLMAAATACIARRELIPPVLDRKRSAAAALVTIAAILVLAGTAYAIWADYARFGYWTGGVPRGGDPPTWEMAIERLFHSFAPWSALLPIAMARMLTSPPRPTAPDAPVRFPEESALRLGVVAWIAFGFLAQTLFSARYGTATFLPLVGAAVAVALLVRDVERSQTGWPSIGLVAFLFVGLIIRDFRGYPSGPVEGLPIQGLEAPEETLTKVIWAALLGLFAVALGLGVAVSPTEERSPPWPKLEGFRELYRGAPSARVFGYTVVPLLISGVPPSLLAEQWKRGVGHRIWSVVAGLTILLVTGFGVACWIAPEAIMVALRTTSLGVKVGRVLAFLPLVIHALVFLSRLALWGVSKLGDYRLAPAMALGLVVGGYCALVYQPRLSSHFSPREVYDTYNELAAEGEPLGEFRVGGRAAAYYAEGEILELGNESELVEFLTRDARVWAAFRADDLASIDRSYRREAGRHLFVADARSERMLLATNQPVEGRENQNYLADAVLDEAPRIQHPLQIDFDGRVTLLGYDLELPHQGYVGPGEQFTITWYFRVEAPIGGNYQMFVHIDGPGQRIHGDHDPVDGRYPVRLWEPGDVVVDRQTLRVPANYTRGNLTIFMGFYAGESRLEVVSGPADDENRARCGVLAIR